MCCGVFHDGPVFAGTDPWKDVSGHGVAKGVEKIIGPLHLPRF
jgi:hypothetical protein